ncbi:MAG: HAMP domain-containing sensor histidine kinase [Pseudomonadota bacterium]
MTLTTVQRPDLLSLWWRPAPIETDLDNEMARAQQHHAVSQLPQMALASFFAALTVIAITMFTVETWKVAIWGTLGLAMGLGQYLGWRGFRNRPLPERVSGRFLRKIELTSLLYGFVWGSVILFLRPNGDLVSFAFLFSLQAGMVAGLGSLLAPLPRVTCRFGFAAMMPGFVMGLVIGEQATIMLSVMAVVFLVSLAAGSINSYHHLAKMVASLLQARDAKRDLTDAIESLNDAFSIYGPDGDIILANTRFQGWFPEGEDTSGGLADEPYRLEDGRWVLRTDRPTRKQGRVVIHTDVTTLKDRERELISARAEAEKADEAKSRFLTSMSHELMMPLNIVLGFSKLMMRDSNIRLSEADISEYAENIYRSGDHLLRLTRDIIDYSKIGMDKYLLEREAVDVSELIDEAVHLTEVYHDIQGCGRFDVKIAPELSKINVDPFAMKRVLTSLFSNSVKFGGTEHRVEVRAGLTANGQPFISARDFGPGIPDHHLENVFEAFYQIDRNPTQSKGGTGLGLTLARHITRLHGGDVMLMSHEDGGLSAAVFLKAESVQRPGQLLMPMQIDSATAA